MRSFVLASLIVLLFSFYRKGNATRYLPSIVWDHYNPMLACKCNWFHSISVLNDTLVKVEIYDRFEFVCPTELLNVRLLDKFSRPKTQMNLNLFTRKWKSGTSDLEGLKAAMKSGEFCDPQHNETKKLLTCKNGQDGIGETVRFAPDTHYYRDDVVVFFNNGDDGRDATLNSKDKKCAMALIVLVSWKEPMKHDFTYGKNLQLLSTDRPCKDLSISCSAQVESTATKPNREISTTIATNASAALNQTTNQTMTAHTNNTTTTETLSPTATTITITTTTELSKGVTPTKNNNSSNVKYASRSGSNKDDWDKFRYGFAVGFSCLVVIDISIVFIYFIYKRSKGKASCSCHYKVRDQCQPTITNNNLAAENKARPSPEKPPLPGDVGNGINNEAYLSSTLKRDQQDNITVLKIFSR